MPLHPRRCSFLYSISCLLDALDGMAARKFQQSTRFGAVLDMVTDRCATACLLVFLSTAKPAYSMVFQGLISLDFASHYMHMYATLVMGGQGQSHKNVSQKNRIMYLYYTNKVCSHQPPNSQQFPQLTNHSSGSSSSAAPSTNSSSSHSTSSASPRPPSRPLSSPSTESRSLFFPARPQRPNLRLSSPRLSLPLQWKWPAPTRWTARSPGRSALSASRSWRSSSGSTLCSCARRACGLRRVIEGTGRRLGLIRGSRCFGRTLKNGRSGCHFGAVR